MNERPDHSAVQCLWHQQYIKETGLVPERCLEARRRWQQTRSTRHYYYDYFSTRKSLICYALSSAMSCLLHNILLLSLMPTVQCTMFVDFTPDRIIFRLSHRRRAYAASISETKSMQMWRINTFCCIIGLFIRNLFRDKIVLMKLIMDWNAPSTRQYRQNAQLLQKGRAELRVVEILLSFKITPLSRTCVSSY